MQVGTAQTATHTAKIPEHCSTDDNHTKREKNMEKEREGMSAVSMFHNACNLLATLVNEQLFEGTRTWYWIGDDVGGVCDFEECDMLNPDDMVRIIENKMTYDEYAEWRDANLDNGRYINLKSWLFGLRHDMLDKEKESE